MSFDQLLWLLKKLFAFWKFIPVSKKLPILVVEDCAEDAEIVSDYVKECGYPVLLARTSEGAVDLLSTHQVRAVMLDIRLKGGSGLDIYFLCARKYPKVAVIFVTGDPSQLIGRIPAGNSVTYVEKATLAISLRKGIHDSLAKVNGLHEQPSLPWLFILVWVFCLLSIAAGYILCSIKHP